MLMLGNVYNYYNSLSEEDNFINKIIYCMDLYKGPYKAILINLYEGLCRGVIIGNRLKMSHHL